MQNIQTLWITVCQSVDWVFWNSSNFLHIPYSFSMKQQSNEINETWVVSSRKVVKRPNQRLKTANWFDFWTHQQTNSEVLCNLIFLHESHLIEWVKTKWRNELIESVYESRTALVGYSLWQNFMLQKPKVMEHTHRRSVACSNSSILPFLIQWISQQHE